MTEEIGAEETMASLLTRNEAINPEEAYCFDAWPYFPCMDLELFLLKRRQFGDRRMAAFDTPNKRLTSVFAIDFRLSPSMAIIPIFTRKEALEYHAISSTTGLSFSGQFGLGFPRGGVSGLADPAKVTESVLLHISMIRKE